MASSLRIPSSTLALEGATLEEETREDVEIEVERRVSDG